ncbi:uncharacterized protein LOC142221412 [Haematobia irritans]|uniref:uncharacterized protein LOC142221412 n=1 Tax=Haematobia irritans TaxID=7368 RepID=UPI003F508273
MVNKVISHILNKRLSDFVNPSWRNEQAGFRTRRSCVDSVNTIRIIVEQSVECKRVQKNNPINMLASLYDGATCRIRHEQQLSDQIKVEEDVRQGCVLLPLLFNILLDVIMSRVSQSHRGITWGLQGNLCDPDYADEICLIANKGIGFQGMLNDLN